MLEIVWDWHIHSRHSPCGHADARLATIVRGVRESGVRRWGVTDHIFTWLNEPSLESAREEFDGLDDQAGGVFAVEASVLREWDLSETRRTGNIWGYHPGGPEDGPEGALALHLPAELVERLGIAYVIAGAHWPLGAKMSPEACVRNYHRQNMFLAAHPQVDIIAHPWWWRKYFNTPTEQLDFFWLEDFSIIPWSMHEEFAAAARQHGKLVELNASNVMSEGYSPRWVEQYVEYLAFLRESGCRFATGSDSHAAAYKPRTPSMAERLAKAGFRQEDLWAGPEA